MPPAPIRRLRGRGSDAVQRIRRAAEVPPAVTRIARLTITAVVAFVLALKLLPYGPRPLLAPLTALLVVQYSIYQTLRAGILRVCAVTLGVLVAVLAAGTIGFSWWALGLTILTALTIGHLLRLRDHLLEVPISAMLIFALGTASGSGAVDRVLETLIGAATGLAATLLVPSVRVRPAEEAVQDIAERLRELLEEIADGLHGDPVRDQAAHWQERAERLAHEIGDRDRELGAAEESVRLNPRTRARRLIDAGVALRDAMETLEHLTLSLRGLTRSLADDERLGAHGRLLTDPSLRRALGDALAAVASAISAYGRLSRSDLDREARPFLAEQALEMRVDIAREKRARLDRLLHERAAAGELWPLFGEVSMDVDRLIGQLRVEHRARARQRWRRRRGASRHLPETPVRVVQQARDQIRRAVEPGDTDEPGGPDGRRTSGPRTEREPRDPGPRRDDR